MLNFFFKKKSLQESQARFDESSIRLKSSSVLSYSWILTGKLAIGPMPKYLVDWHLLENNGIKKRFSCCYPEENIFTPIPPDWISKEISLPDHRKQEELKTSTLILILREAINLILNDEKPIYLHCFAGQERSSLVAIGIVSLLEGKDLFDSLAYVRQCYPKARPLYDHLDILEQALIKYQ